MRSKGTMRAWGSPGPDKASQQARARAIAPPVRTQYTRQSIGRVNSTGDPAGYQQ